MSAFDRRLAARALGYAVAAQVVAALVVAATDGGDVWPRRLAMIAALGPVGGAVGAAAAAAIAEARGELRALAALGVSRARSAWGAPALGGAAVALSCSASLASGSVDAAALFPRPEGVITWTFVAGHGATGGLSDGAFHAPALGLRVGPGGAFALEAAAPSASVLVARGSVLACLAIAAVALPLAACAPARARTRALAVAIAAALGVAAFQAVASGRAQAAWLVAPPAALLAATLTLSWRSRA